MKTLGVYEALSEYQPEDSPPTLIQHAQVTMPPTERHLCVHDAGEGGVGMGSFLISVSKHPPQAI